MLINHFPAASALTMLMSMPVAADEARELANLPKAAFVEALEENFVSVLDISEQLMLRVDPSFTDVIDATSPITEKERDAFSCAYDLYAEADLLSDLAFQITSTEPLRDRMTANPELNYVDLFFDEALQEELTGPDPKFFHSVAGQCEGVLILNEDRFTPNPAFWAAVQEAIESQEETNDADTE